MWHQTFTNTIIKNGCQPGNQNLRKITSLAASHLLPILLPTNSWGGVGPFGQGVHFWYYNQICIKSSFYPVKFVGCKCTPPQTIFWYPLAPPLLTSSSSFMLLGLEAALLRQALFYPTFTLVL